MEVGLGGRPQVEGMARRLGGGSWRCRRSGRSSGWAVVAQLHRVEYVAASPVVAVATVVVLVHGGRPLQDGRVEIGWLHGDLASCPM